MNDGKISDRYAKALFLTAVEQHCDRQVRIDVDSLVVCLHTLPEFEILLLSPVVSAGDKYKIFEQMFADKFCALTMDFLKMLTANKRESYLKIICYDYTAFFTKHHNIKRVVLTTAVDLGSNSDFNVSEIVRKCYPDCVVEISEEVKPEIIGGMIINVDDLMFDGSVKTRLSTIREKLRNQK